MLLVYGRPSMAGVEKKEGADAPPMIPLHADLPETLSLLPMSPGFPPYRLRLYGGFWLPDLFLKGIEASHARFRPRPTDVLLASFPKSGTTWLKALSFSALNRVAHPPSAVADHPLSHANPHNLVYFLEANPEYQEQLQASPRLLGTHLPYSLLPHAHRSMDGEEDGSPSGGRIVYVCRDPKDTLVSLWHFHEKTTPAVLGVPDPDDPLTAMPTFEEAFEFFCDGQVVAGPQWRHALEYWKASRRRPDQVLFLKYEDMLRDPTGNLRTLAAFMGCAFSPEEETAGVLRQIVELCSLKTLKGLQINMGGRTTMGIQSEAFFRNGVAGDWSSCMTPAMAASLDKLVSEALTGSTLTFGSTGSSNNYQDY